MPVITLVTTPLASRLIPAILELFDVNAQAGQMVVPILRDGFSVTTQRFGSYLSPEPLHPYNAVRFLQSVGRFLDRPPTSTRKPISPQWSLELVRDELVRDADSRVATFYGPGRTIGLNQFVEQAAKGANLTITWGSERAQVMAGQAFSTYSTISGDSPKVVAGLEMWTASITFRDGVFEDLANWLRIPLVPDRRDLEGSIRKTLRQWVSEYQQNVSLEGSDPSSSGITLLFENRVPLRFLSTWETAIKWATPGERPTVPAEASGEAQRRFPDELEVILFQRGQKDPEWQDLATRLRRLVGLIPFAPQGDSDAGRRFGNALRDLQRIVRDCEGLAARYIGPVIRFLEERIQVDRIDSLRGYKYPLMAARIRATLDVDRSTLPPGEETGPILEELTTIADTLADPASSKTGEADNLYSRGLRLLTLLTPEGAAQREEERKRQRQREVRRSQLRASLKEGSGSSDELSGVVHSTGSALGRRRPGLDEYDGHREGDED